LRSFWGVNSNTNRNGVNVNSTGALNNNNVANEFAVAPAFYSVRMHHGVYDKIKRHVYSFPVTYIVMWGQKPDDKSADIFG